MRYTRSRLIRAITRIDDFMAIGLHVPDWPRWARRAFVIFLPLSGPMWITIQVVCGTIQIFLLIVNIFVQSIKTLWADD